MGRCAHRKKRIIGAYLSASLMLVLSAVLGIVLGASGIGFLDILRAIGRGTESAEMRIFLYVRLPRVLASLACGAALSVSGAVIQGVLANRLASPSIIGVNSGAALAVTLCSAFGAVGGAVISVSAFFGALLAVALISVAAYRWGSSRGMIILVGVALSSFFGAISDTVTTLSSDALIMSNDFRIGDFSFVTYSRLLPAAVLIAIALIALFVMSNELDVLTLGDERAAGLGMNTSLMRALFLILSALLAGAAVSVCGLLSFVGLLVPHAVRRACGTRAVHLLPLCALFGAGFVTLCDTLARTVALPYELPVGIIMAFCGAPFFIFILIKGNGVGRDA